MQFADNFEVWKNILLKPKETIDSQLAKKDFGIKEGFVNYLIAQIVNTIVSFISISMSPVAAAAVAKTFGGSVYASLGISFVIGMAMTFVMVGVYHIIASLLGGKAQYAKAYYMVSLTAVPVAVIGIIGLVPVIGLLTLLVSLYALYVLVLIISKLYGLDTMKAAIVVLVPFIAMVIIVAVIGAAAVAGALASAG